MIRKKKAHIKKVHKPIKRTVAVVLAVCLVITLYYLAQRFWAHKDGYFLPDYPRVELTQDSDYETIFLQTGLGKPAVDKLLETGQFQKILDAQELFFNPPKAECTEFLGWFTREDCLERPGTPLVDLQPGDILISLSTHSFGWRHGHAGLVIDKGHVLEAEVLGEDSKVNALVDWNVYSNYAVLRVKGVTKQQQEEAVAFAMEAVKGVPYSLPAGFIGPKAPAPDDWQFGVHCSYLAWYVWNHLGYDLDSDGGRLVSTYDLLHSDLVEIVQIYGMNPAQFCKN